MSSFLGKVAKGVVENEKAQKAQQQREETIAKAKSLATKAVHFANKTEQAIRHTLTYMLVEGVVGHGHARFISSDEKAAYHAKHEPLQSLRENVVSTGAVTTAVTLYAASQLAHKKLDKVLKLDERVTPNTYKSIFAKEGVYLVVDTALACAVGAAVGAPLVPVAGTCLLIRGYSAGKQALKQFAGFKEDVKKA